MKIGIITFHRPINFGATLQAFALVKKLDSMNISNEIIDYRNEVHEKQINNTKFKTAQGIKSKIKCLLFGRLYNNKERKFRNFLNNNINISNRLYTKENIHEVNDQYSMFMSGSDQVWNLNLTNKDYNYFLKFVEDNNAKKSYASSFGYSSIPDEYKDECKKYLAEYNKLAVREQQGRKIILDLIGKSCEVVLDPTLLLTKEEWLKYAKKPNIKLPKNYILLYAVSPTEADYNIARKLSKREKMKVILINYTMMYVSGMKNCLDIGPEEFLWLMNNASLIVTNSFHGTAFSINLNKPFFVRLSMKQNNGNSRIENLINLVGLKDRYIDESNIRYDTNIDWKTANEKLNENRNKSLEYLKSCVEEGNVNE